MVQQCFITNEPYVASHEGYPNTTLLVNKSGFNDYDDVLFTTQSEIKNHPKLVSDVVHAVEAGWSNFWANPSPTDKALASTYGDTERGRRWLTAQVPDHDRHPPRRLRPAGEDGAVGQPAL